MQVALHLVITITSKIVFLVLVIVVIQPAITLVVNAPASTTAAFFILAITSQKY